jgi:hypothetical protein
MNSIENKLDEILERIMALEIKLCKIERKLSVYQELEPPIFGEPNIFPRYI